MGVIKAGRKPRWGARKASTVHFPEVLYDLAREKAANNGESLSELIVLELSEKWGIELPETNSQPNLRTQPPLPLPLTG